ncbi:MAG: hypothetical protein AAF235_01970 [Planctomycetota bacterium]
MTQPLLDWYGARGDGRMPEPAAQPLSVPDSDIFPPAALDARSDVDCDVGPGSSSMIATPERTIAARGTGDARTDFDRTGSDDADDADDEPLFASFDAARPDEVAPSANHPAHLRTLDQRVLGTPARTPVDASGRYAVEVDPGDVEHRERPVVCEASAADISGPPELRREQIIGRILDMNPTAPATFLDQFTTERLGAYHDRLARARRPRGRDSRWLRVAETRAVTMHERVL